MVEILAHEISGEYGKALVYSSNIDDTAFQQIEMLCNSVLAKNSNIRIMPDYHAGAGCVIGTTMQVHDKVCPNLVGVDIGCGLYARNIGQEPIDFVKLDRFIRKKIPSGFHIHKEPLTGVRGSMGDASAPLLSKLTMPLSEEDKDRAYRSIGTLGGGNHFIEVGIDSKGDHWVVVHSGSRNLGLKVAKYHQEIAITKDHDGPKDLQYLEGIELNNYLNDMRIMTEYAKINRQWMIHEIVCAIGNGQTFDGIETVHNTIDDSRMLRKGAVSAQLDEYFLVPLNMADGILLCKGRGNEEWNYSAPHGAGRLYSRSKAKKELSMDDFKERMDGIYSTSIQESTLDEAPMAYKNGNEIREAIGETAEIVDHFKTLYNFKSCDSRKR